MIVVEGLAGTKHLTLSTSADSTYAESVELTIELVIFDNTKNSTVLGKESEIEQTGFLYDKTLITSESDERTKYNTYTGFLESNSRDGTVINSWNSGSLEGIDFLKLNTDYKPLIKSGTYSINSNIRTLYSDYSIQSVIDSFDVTTSNYTDLDINCITSSLRIFKCKRLNNLINIIYNEYAYVDSLENDYTKQFIIDTDNNRFLINKNPIVDHSIDFTNETYSEIETYGIYLGRGINSPQDFFLDNFPIVSSTIKAYVLYDDLTIERWDFKNNLNYAESTEPVLILNKDLGVISCGGYEYDSLILSKSISSSDLEIEFFLKEDQENYPRTGILIIGTEQIAFSDRSSNKFKNLTRGYNSTTANSHSIGDIIELERKGYPLTTDARLFIYYQSTARFEYEVDNFFIRTGDISCKPSQNNISSKILQIQSKTSDLNELILSVNKDSLSSDIFGPLYFGNDIAKLTTEALDSEGNPVDNIEITLEILDPISGFIDGENTSVSKISNSEGKIFNYYNSPVDKDNYSIKFSSLQYSSGQTIFALENNPSIVKLTDIYLFQILKHDPTIGTIGVKYDINSYTTSTRENSDNEIIVNNILGQEYNNGNCYIIDNSGIVYTRTIVQAENNSIFITPVLPVSLTLETIYVLTEEDTEWDSEELNGINVIVYKWNDNAEHPLTGNAGAYCPIFPISLVSNTIIYDELLTQSDPDDRNNNIGGYMIIMPIVVSLRAKAIDPYSGQYVYSNTIKLQINLPNYLVGVDSSGTLPIPKGFNLNTSEENIGSGLGGANFYSINTSGGLFGLKIRSRH